MQGLSAVAEHTDIDELFVTVQVTADLLDCNHNCRHMVVKRSDPSFQTAILPADLSDIKAAIKSVSRTGIAYSMIDYERDDCRGILLIVRYDPHIIKDHTLDQLITVAEREMTKANEAYRRVAVRVAAQC